MAIYMSIKSLVYKELQPLAQAAGCQILLLDSKTYKSYTNALESKMKSLGIDIDNYRRLIDAIEEFGCVAVLKSKKYYGPPEIASFFSSVGLDADDVHMLSSVNAKKHEEWGDFDSSIPANKAKFFYWFYVHVRNEDNEVVMEDGDGGGSAAGGAAGDAGGGAASDSGSIADVGGSISATDVIGDCDHKCDGYFGPGCFHRPFLVGMPRSRIPYFISKKKKKKKKTEKIGPNKVEVIYDYDDLVSEKDKQ